MIVNPPSSQHVIGVRPLEAHPNWLERLRERGASALMLPVMFFGTACYVLAMWFLEREGEAAH
jgi:hypothetical protein